VQIKSGTVSYRIGKGPWQSSSQPILLNTFFKVLKNNSWRSSKHS